MRDQISLKKIILIPLIKIVITVAVLVGSVLLCEQLRNYLTERTRLNGDLRDVIIAILESSLALIVYIFLFRFLEKRKITELSWAKFGKSALPGFVLGLGLQTLVILILYFSNNYSVERINPFSFLIPGFSQTLIAGFVGEIILRGIIFRLIEEQIGTTLTIIFFALLFVVLHINTNGATVLSVAATTIQAGILISAAYVFTKSLWFPIFFHFAWDFAEPVIYGGINTGIHVEKTLLTSKITGAAVLTGGQSGPGNSMQALIFCLIASVIFLWLAKRKNNFIKPYWKRLP
jgi:membrane protease YdiL (CAAX protease family)